MIATLIARRIEADSPEGKVSAAYRLLFSRPPLPAEIAVGSAFLHKHGLERYCHLLLCASEFSYIR